MQAAIATPDRATITAPFGRAPVLKVASVFRLSASSIALLDADSLKTLATFKTGARPNGAVIVARSGVAIAACIGDDKEAPTLHLFGLSDHEHVSIDLPGRPRWCVTDAAAERLFLCIREPSMVLVAR